MTYAETRKLYHDALNEYHRRRERCLARFEKSQATLALLGRIQDLRRDLGRERVNLQKGVEMTARPV